MAPKSKAKNGPQKKSQRKKSKSYSLFPALHNDVNDQLRASGLEFTFHETDEGAAHDDSKVDAACLRDYHTNVMGRFNCRNPACDTTGWSSKLIAITIRMYEGRKYNARVYHQRCRSCNWVARPRLDESYAERVVYRLKKWSGVEVEQPDYEPHDGPPHEERLCEGCNAGVCTKRRQSLYY